jgi:hypothetical protein
VDAAGTRRSEPQHASRAAIILGNDAILAARPNTTAQLTHACGAAGFDIVVPPSWGDELVARRCLERLADRAEDAVVACACDRVRALLPNLDRTITGYPRHVSLAAPPVAAARYLRLVYGDPLLVTYVGDCPSAADPSIDARFSPAGFLASLHRQGIEVTAQPNDASAAEADRWRRYESVPGGLPARRFLARPPIDRVVRTVEPTDLGVVLRSSRAKVLLDLAPAAGCYCSAESDRIAETEPERSASPIVVAPATLDLSPESSAPRGRHTLRARLDDIDVATPSPPTVIPPPPAPPAKSETSSATETPVAPAAIAASRPEVRTATARAVETPNVVARAPEPPTHRPNPVAARPAATPRTTPARPVANQDAGAAAGRERRRRVALVAIPAAVLGVAMALGAAVYLGVARRATPGPPSAPAGPPDSVVSKSASGELGPPASADSSRRAAGRTAVTPSPVSDSAAAAAERDRAMRADSARGRARRTRRAPAPEIVPGWLPQGQPAFVPRDTSVTPRRDSTAPRVRPDTTPQA